jgi:predicted Zn-ribbon and HTH transcriptional regulator
LTIVVPEMVCPLCGYAKDFPTAARHPEDCPECGNADPDNPRETDRRLN